MSDDDDDNAIEQDTPTTVGDVVDSVKAFGESVKVADAYARLGLDNHLKVADLVKNFDRLKEIVVDSPRPTIDPGFLSALKPIEYELFDYEFDDSPQRTAEATERTAAVLQDVHTVTADLVRLTNLNLQLTQAQQESARRTERFTRGMTWASLAVALASLGAAGVAILTSGG